MHPQALLDQPLGRDSADGVVHPPVHPIAPAIQLQLEVQRG